MAYLITLYNKHGVRAFEDSADRPPPILPASTADSLSWTLAAWVRGQDPFEPAPFQPQEMNDRLFDGALKALERRSRGPHMSPYLRRRRFEWR